MFFKNKKGDALFADASNAFNRGDYANSVRLCEQAIKAGTHSYDLALVYATYGYSLTKIGRDEEGFEAHKKATQINPKNAASWRYYGMSLRQTCDFDEAEICYERALAIDANDEFTLASLGALYVFRNKPKKAIEILEPYIQSGSQSGVTMSNLALAYGMVGNFEAAEDALGKAVYKGYTNWLSIQQRLEAMQTFRKSLKLDEVKDWLPTICNQCGAPANRNNVQWISNHSAMCGYCGSTFKKR